MLNSVNWCRQTGRRIVHFAVFGLMFVTFASAALELHDAKQQGLVGETSSGYLEPVARATPEVAALVKAINAQRRDHYQRIAEQNGISLTDVELLAAKKAIEKTPAGQYVQVDGEWRKK